MSDPNSAHQWWSKWTVRVVPSALRISRSEATVTTNAARFFRKAFGSATQLRVTHQPDGVWLFEVRTEGHPVHDPAYVAHLSQAFQRFFVTGFGVGTRVSTTARLEAGSRQDGTPAEQLLILPCLTFDLEPTGV